MDFDVWLLAQRVFWSTPRAPLELGSGDLFEMSHLPQHRRQRPAGQSAYAELDSELMPNAESDPRRHASFLGRSGSELIRELPPQRAF